MKSQIHQTETTAAPRQRAHITFDLLRISSESFPHLQQCLLGSPTSYVMDTVYHFKSFKWFFKCKDTSFSVWTFIVQVISSFIKNRHKADLCLGRIAAIIDIAYSSSCVLHINQFYCSAEVLQAAPAAWLFTLGTGCHLLLNHRFDMSTAINTVLWCLSLTWALCECDRLCLHTGLRGQTQLNVQQNATQA